MVYRAELVAERVGDYVVYCTPDKHATDAQEFREGAISLSNCIHEDYSVVDVTSKPDEKGFLLEVASAMTGLGVTIHEAIVQVGFQHPCAQLHAMMPHTGLMLCKPC